MDAQQSSIKNAGDSLDDSLRDENEEEEEGLEIAKICLNCDLLTNDLQSTPKGFLCNPCYTYWKDTGVMKPDHLINSNKYFNENDSKNDKLDKQMNHGQSTATAITSTANGVSGKVNNQKISHKSLRKSPKGIYLNCDELAHLAKSDNNQIFESLNVLLRTKKEEVQRNKQQITDHLMKLSNENALEISIDVTEIENSKYLDFHKLNDIFFNILRVICCNWKNGQYRDRAGLLMRLC